MKTMADAGCWSRSALSNTISDDDAFAALQGSSIAWNGTVYNYMRLAEESEGVVCAAYDLTKDNIVACEEYNNSDIPLTGITAPAILKASVTVNGHTNTWNLYVMENLADTPFPECPVPILRADSYKLRRLIADGGRAIVTADGLADAIDGSFEPVFWSPAFFPSKKTCGMMIDHTHPVFHSFPTERYTDFQWREPVIHSKNMDTGSFPEDFTPIVEPVPNFYDNTRLSPLFEARVGRADILFCGFDLAGTDPASLQLKKSILEYVASGDFKPLQRLNKDVFGARS
ncbi:MAG: hypothetical protein LUE87_00860 [Lachnospiraceae bacterium]|nr:hypothetical protein [Lachnospiraceae bacterium]